ncbi:unnamed protein product [Alternaria alternata]
MAEKNKNPAPRDVEAIARDNQLNSPLLRLPAELRNRIYHFTFDTNVVVLDLPGYKNSTESYYPPGTPYPLALAQSCTQCRYEALPYFWKTTIFQLPCLHNISYLLHDTDETLRDQIQILGLGIDVACCFRDDMDLYRYAEGCAALRTVIVCKLLRDTGCAEMNVKRTFGAHIKVSSFVDGRWIFSAK